MAAITIREAEIQRLGRFYRNAVKDIAREFVANIDFATAREAAQIQSVIVILQELEGKTAAWANKNIAALYRLASKQAGQTFRRAKMARSIKSIRSFAVVNDRAVQALLTDPQVGFLSNINGGIQQIKNRMRFIQNQAKMLKLQQSLFDQTIARVGFLQGKGINEIRDVLAKEMASLKTASDLTFTRKASKLPASHIVKNVADLPFVKIPTVTTSTGYRRLRIDKYAELLARTKTGQAASLARRNKALEHNVPLIQVSKNKPMHDDACYLYIGKVFALTQSAKNEWGVPLVSELPNGGVPLHPNCTHSELIFIPSLKTKREIELATMPPPAWALNRPYAEVQKEYERRGGAANINEFSKTAGALGRTTGGRERARRSR